MLLGFRNTVGQYHSLRELTDEELAEHARHTPLAKEAENRLVLLRILDKNYKQWRSFLDDLLSKRFVEIENTTEELDRLLLNYLAFAYSTKAHFEVSLRKRSRKNNQDVFRKYEDFLAKICNVSWNFAFMLDYRGYVQHVGRAVGHYSRNTTDTSVNIEITANAESLVNNSRDWKNSKLTPEKGDIDLVLTTKDFHHHLMNSYANYIARTFFPELESAHSFYEGLTSEVKKVEPQARMVFLIPSEKSDAGDGKTSMKLQVVEAPNYLFQEIGVHRHKA